MSILKLVLITTTALSLANAKIDFTNFSDICDKNISADCKNIKSEIKTIQYILKLKVNSKIQVNGAYDAITKGTIISLQKNHHLWARGYIGKQTKSLLNDILYGKIDKRNDIKKVKISNTQKPTIKKVIKLAQNKKIANIKKVNKKKIDYTSYNEFIKSVDLKKSYAIYKDPKLLKMTKRSSILLKVDTKVQRVKLLVDGKVALDAPCTTGAKRKFEPNTKTYRDKHTPKGTFKIIEKIALKRSTIFGDIYLNGKKVFHGDRRKYKGSWKGAIFIGHPLRNWMRLTSGGIGLHASKYIKRYPGSNGCIRLQPKVAQIIFQKIKPGTKVKVN